MDPEFYSPESWLAYAVNAVACDPKGEVKDLFTISTRMSKPFWKVGLVCII